MKLFAAIACLFLTAASAFAGRAPLPKVLGGLERDYHEVIVFVGVEEAGLVIVTAAPGGGTFTVMKVTPDGLACGLAVGGKWRGSVSATSPEKES